MTFASHTLSLISSNNSYVAKNLMPFYAGLPDGLSSRAPTGIGTSCGWQLITEAARFAVSFLCSCLLRLFLRRHFTQHPAHGGVIAQIISVCQTLFN